VIENVPKREGRLWFDDKYLEAVKKRSELRKKLLKNPTEENKITYENWRKETQNIKKRKKN